MRRAVAFRVRRRREIHGTNELGIENHRWRNEVARYDRRTRADAGRHRTVTARVDSGAIKLISSKRDVVTFRFNRRCDQDIYGARSEENVRCGGSPAPAHVG